MSELKPYDADTKCEKCGFDRSEDQYHNSHEASIKQWTEYNPLAPGFHVIPPMPTCWIKEPHLKRTCLRCGFIWYEAPLDAVKEECAHDWINHPQAIYCAKCGKESPRDERTDTIEECAKIAEKWARMQSLIGPQHGAGMHHAAMSIARELRLLKEQP